MNKLALLFFSFLSMAPVAAQHQWQQQVDYRIDVTLNDKEKTLTAYERLTYHNNSPDTLFFIWFHVWPNAYKNDQTAFSDQLLENGNTDFYFSTPEQRGYINRLDFKVDGKTANIEDHPQHIDIIKVRLPEPLVPGGKTVITTPFHVKLPFNFSRGGFDGNSFQVTQWYPKPAVYDQQGWHPMPYLDQGEFYSNFGSFDVRITVPADYAVAATGALQDDAEKEWLKKRKDFTAPGQPVHTNQTKTLQFVQSDVHDFAWFANKDFIVENDTCALPSGSIIEVWSFYTAEEKEVWKHAIQNAKDAIRFYSASLGEYPYHTVTVVQGPESFGGGMEYPTITILSPVATEKDLDLLIAHELGHNWFYGVLATNERQYPWMDEGMNTFYTSSYETWKYGTKSSVEEIGFQTLAFNRKDQPISTNSEAFNSLNYGLVAYHKASKWLSLLQEQLGEQAFTSMMQEYYATWKFRHPTPADFQKIASKYLGTATVEYFNLLDTTGVLPGKAFSGTSIIMPLSKTSVKNYFQSPTKQAVIISPAIGFNVYDKLMLGGIVTNYKLPPDPFRFFLAPLYATGTKRLNGLGRLSYSATSGGWIRKTDFFVNGSAFSMNQFTDTAGKRTHMTFRKLVPGVRFTFQASPRSTVVKQLQFKTFLIQESTLRVRRDTLISGMDTSFRLLYTFPDASRYLNQLQYSITNFRSLYPYDLTLQLEHATDFLRATITGNQFFNYPSGGGLHIRMFAGKFIYLNDATLQNKFATTRYHLNMTGANGYEDYTYSNYFVGRNEFEGLWSQQVMMRDGGFKARTDLLSSKIGKSDNWLIAANFVSTIPPRLNPLSLLPIKIPLRVFADVGTYAEPWQQTELDKFLFSAGVNVSLFRDVINIWFPIVNSKVYNDYFKSAIPDNRLMKTMTFTINFMNRDLKRLNSMAEF